MTIGAIARFSLNLLRIDDDGDEDRSSLDTSELHEVGRRLKNACALWIPSRLPFSPGASRALKIEAYCSKPTAKKLVKRFGGRVERLAKHGRKTPAAPRGPLSIRGKLKIFSDKSAGADGGRPGKTRERSSYPLEWPLALVNTPLRPAVCGSSRISAQSIA